MTKLKTLLAIMVLVVIFVLWVPTGQAEIESLNQSEIISTWDVVEEQIIYTFDMTKEELKKKVDVLVGNYNISSAIVEECTTQVPDNYEKCIKDVIGVSNAESTIFRNWMSPSNNWFGLMYKGVKRRFSSVEEWIKVRVSLYAKNNWVDRATWEDWLRKKYCTSACTHWVKNYNSAIKKLGL